jgi:hypothetical protein
LASAADDEGAIPLAEAALKFKLPGRDRNIGKGEGRKGGRKEAKKQRRKERSKEGRKE